MLRGLPAANEPTTCASSSRLLHRCPWRRVCSSRLHEFVATQNASRRPMRGGVAGHFDGLKQKILGLFDRGEFGVEAFQKR